MRSIENKVIDRIYGKGRGWAFSQIDFSDLGSRSAIDLALNRLEKKKTIRRVIRGIYDYPQESSLTKELIPPYIPNIANAIARKNSWEIVPDGETALNILGITNQVPSKYVYMSNGKSKKYTIDNRILELRKSIMKEIMLKHFESILIVQALRALGKEQINNFVINKVRNYLDEKKYESILKDTKNVTSWIYETIREICK